MDIPDDTAARMFSEIRDSRRPSIKDVLAIISSAFGRMKIPVSQIVDGPDSWVWEDTESVEIGFPRYYVLSLSNSEGVEGYPLFTVRQAYSVRFDTWVTVSSLIIGPDSVAIAHSLSLTLAHHAGAFAGMKHVVSTIAANQSSPMAGMVAVQKLLEASPLKVDLDDEAMLVDDPDAILELVETGSDRKLVN